MGSIVIHRINIPRKTVHFQLDLPSLYLYYFNPPKPLRVIPQRRKIHKKHERPSLFTSTASFLIFAISLISSHCQFDGILLDLHASLPQDLNRHSLYHLIDSLGSLGTDLTEPHLHLPILTPLFLANYKAYSVPTSRAGSRSTLFPTKVSVNFSLTQFCSTRSSQSSTRKKDSPLVTS